jgi:hypothetical protein
MVRYLTINKNYRNIPAILSTVVEIPLKTSSALSFYFVSAESESNSSQT